MKSSREQFEEWLPGSFDNQSSQNKDVVRRGSDGEYVYGRTRKLWEAWQASREAMSQEEVTTAPFIKVSE